MCLQCWQRKPVGAAVEQHRPARPEVCIPYAARPFPSWARRTYHVAVARALIDEDKLLIAHAIRRLRRRPVGVPGKLTPTGPTQWASQVSPTCDWARRAYHAAAARALIHDDKQLIPDATCTRLCDRLSLPTAIIKFS